MRVYIVEYGQDSPCEHKTMQRAVVAQDMVEAAKKAEKARDNWDRINSIKIGNEIAESPDAR